MQKLVALCRCLGVRDATDGGMILKCRILSVGLGRSSDKNKAADMDHEHRNLTQSVAKKTGPILYRNPIFVHYLRARERPASR